MDRFRSSRKGQVFVVDWQICFPFCPYPWQEWVAIQYSKALCTEVQMCTVVYATGMWQSLQKTWQVDDAVCYWYQCTRVVFHPVQRGCFFSCVYPTCPVLLAPHGAGSNQDQT